MSKKLDVLATYNDDVIGSFKSASIELRFSEDQSGIVSSENAVAHVVIYTEAKSADDLPEELVKSAIDAEDTGEFVLTETLPGKETLTLSLSRFVVVDNNFPSAADDKLSMRFTGVAATIAADDSDPFESKREFL